jgi:superfamily II DNA or RNA helicase
LYFKKLLIKRARIVKKATNKLSELRALLGSLDDISRTLIYCSESEQLEGAAEVLNSLGITYRRFTGAEGTKPMGAFQGKSERQVIIDDFEIGNTQVLLAMKCLDEGVDIPSARTGIILASSTNPREFIQRRGRLLRRSPGKDKAEIFDILVAPSKIARDDTSEISIWKKELSRVDEFAEDALNEVEIRDKIMEKIWTIAG